MRAYFPFLFTCIDSMVLFIYIGNLKEFETQIINHPSNHVYLVEFYSPMCGSCEEFKPVWNQLESSVKDIVGTAKVDSSVRFFSLFFSRFSKLCPLYLGLH